MGDTDIGLVTSEILLILDVTGFGPCFHLSPFTYHLTYALPFRLQPDLQTADDGFAGGAEDVFKGGGQRRFGDEVVFATFPDETERGARAVEEQPVVFRFFGGQRPEPGGNAGRGVSGGAGERR